MKTTENNFSKKNIGDMPVEEFRNFGHQLIDWVADYFQNIESYPVLPNINPGDIKSKLPKTPPVDGESMEEILKDIDGKIMPGITHWNHPNFMAYFNSTSSGPGILAELLSAAFNANGMLWKTSPAATELEEVTLDWFRQMLGLSENFWGIIYDTASVSSMHAIAAAREQLSEYQFRQKGLAGRKEIPRLKIYTSEQAHSSIEKGAITLGIGIDGIRKIPVDNEFRMIPSQLEKAITEDRENGWLPFCVVATVGTTSTTSIDPVNEIADICKREKLWLHVDAAHAGVAAIIPEMRFIIDGIEKADSLVVNPHKWMFTPVDLSILYTRKPKILKQAFSLVPEYLKTSEDNIVINYMDYGIQLGRRFRSLKLWFIIRYFGTEGIANRIKDHLRLGKIFAEWIGQNTNFEKMAPVPFSTICFRAHPQDLNDEQKLNELNEQLMNSVNSTGKIFLTHTKLNGKFVCRLVISGLRTEEKHVMLAQEILQNKLTEILT
ncbi:MAG: pyridoxal-dependent decarboxylase [Bacteroidetes bacterium]|nr:pyridoxal-dependent decarboxylase [Bacteroidota bacterium]